MQRSHLWESGDPRREGWDCRRSSHAHRGHQRPTRRQNPAWDDTGRSRAVTLASFRTECFDQNAGVLAHAVLIGAWRQSSRLERIKFGEFDPGIFGDLARMTVRGAGFGK